MLAALRKFFAVTPPAPVAQALPISDGLMLRAQKLEDQVDQLYRRVAALEAERVEILAEWVRTRDTLTRQLKRLGAIRSKVNGEDDIEPEEDEDVDDLLQQLRTRRR